MLVFPVLETNSAGVLHQCGRFWGVVVELAGGSSAMTLRRGENAQIIRQLAG